MLRWHADCKPLFHPPFAPPHMQYLEGPDLIPVSLRPNPHDEQYNPAQNKFLSKRLKAEGAAPGEKSRRRNYQFPLTPPLTWRFEAPSARPCFDIRSSWSRRSLRPWMALRTARLHSYGRDEAPLPLTNLASSLVPVMFIERLNLLCAIGGGG